ncbi:MAG: hypothetical protein D6704_00240 [Nitrospirae bacterium]|nr:MAG: hypothetical protein D6704_00240 [Nitrospirota bacterium]
MICKTGWVGVSVLLLTLGLLIGGAGSKDGRMSAFAQASPSPQANYVLLIVLEGVGPSSIHLGDMPILQKLAREGAVSWHATSIMPPLPVPAMASLLTGLTVKKHRITPEWETYDFSRSFLRAPTVFDYLDLAGGRDTALFFMDERFYQLARPEIYIDKQICGYAKPECNPSTLVLYVKDYLAKVLDKGGHGFRLFDVPGLLVAHFPQAARAGAKYGWQSSQYRQALQTIDTAVAEMLQLYQEIGALGETMVIITGLTGSPISSPGENGSHEGSETKDGLRVIPWIAWGANVKSGYEIRRPVSILDTAATIMEALGLETHTEWESHALSEIFQRVPERRTTGNE